MKKLSILLLLLSFTSKASTNYAIETLVRSFPIGAFAKYTVGKSALLWGDKKHKKDITYGFIRPELEFRTSGLVNYVGGRLSVYPLPILGLFTGSEIGKRSLNNLDTFDCDLVQCTGTMRRNIFGVRAAIAYKNWFFTTEIRNSTLNFSTTDRPYVDEITTLLGTGEDKTNVQLYVTGLQFSQHQVGLIYLQNKIKNNGSKSSMTSLIHQYNNINLPFGKDLSKSLLSSIGAFKTRGGQQVLTFLFQLKLNSAREFLLF